MTGSGQIRALMLAAMTALAGCDGAQVSTPAAQISPSAELLEARLDDGAVRALLAPAGRNGRVTTWQSVDRVALSLDEGVLVATRGLGQDLMSADVTGTQAFLQGQGAPDWTRLHSYLDGNYRTLWRGYRCTGQLIADEGLRHRSENCHGPDGNFTNHYWQDASGAVVKSRQWIGPVLGHVETELQRQGGQ